MKDRLPKIKYVSSNLSVGLVFISDLYCLMIIEWWINTRNKMEDIGKKICNN